MADLPEVCEDLRPAASAILARNMTYAEAMHAFRMTLIDEALKRNEGVQLRAAMRLVVSPTWIKQVVEGPVTPPPKRSVARKRKTA